MCGIAGYIDFTFRSDDATLKKMADVLIHRGPDDSGYEIFNHPGAAIGFGFRRLSIIELTSLGHQPMQNDDGKYHIIFNGEVYNYREIREELSSKGHRFRSNSDTEVILKSYIQWGSRCVERFIGMFAIAIFDNIQNKIILFRDRPGVKPLYYYWKNGLFLFASELKSFHQHPAFEKELDYNSVSLYLQHGYVPAPYSVFTNTFKLKPGHYLEIDLEKQAVDIQKYWDVFDYYNAPPLDISFDEAAAEMERIMKSAFSYRMIADVPVGVFLSGGYDSTAVTALLQSGSTPKIKTYTIGFNEPDYNEAPYAKEVASILGTEHHEYFCTFREAIDIVPKLPEIYDEPMGDSSAIPTTLVSRIARQHVTVALSADGGDEIFGGYPKYIKGVKYYNLISKIPSAVSRVAARMVRYLTPRHSGILSPDQRQKLIEVLDNPGDAIGAFNTVTEVYTFHQAASLIKKDVRYCHTPFDDDALLRRDLEFLGRFQAAEFKTYLVDDILQKVDRATMSVSLEGREPFLDQRIIEFAARLPASFKLQNGTGKMLLRHIVHKYVPEKLMNRPKMGFGVPVSRWCRKELRELLLEHLDPELIRKQGIFDHKMVHDLLTRYMNHQKTDFQKIWFLLMFQMWHKRWN